MTSTDKNEDDVKATGDPPAPQPGAQAPTPPAPPAAPALPVVFRPVLTRIILMVTGAVVLAVLLVIAVIVPVSASTWGLGDRFTVAGTGLAAWGVLAVLCRPKVLADAEGVTVVNLTAKRRLAWAEIIRVSLRPGDPWVTLDLADGTTMAAMGIQPGLARERALADARALRALVEAHGSGTGAPGN
ncbi:PH domain-containing protein [Streptomyces carpaticus]|uniref:PH domain-containing protein n=1 Tax=Streptomyces carpaticus TaxID=285558 RepID=UPI0031F9529D